MSLGAGCRGVRPASPKAESFPVTAVGLRKFLRLDEHAARITARVVDAPRVGLQHKDEAQDHVLVLGGVHVATQLVGGGPQGLLEAVALGGCCATGPCQGDPAVLDVASGSGKAASLLYS